MTAVLSDYLRYFNRKERFFLVGWSLGNSEFTLSPDFRRSVSSAIDLPIPSEAFAAMDYHLDWLYASALFATTGEADGVHDNGDGLISGNQEDIDLLIAFRGEQYWNVIMIEAKGVTPWANRQMASKARRLEGVFGRDGDRWPSIRPHFVLASPNEPQNLDCSAWPRWMRREDGGPYWTEMAVPPGLWRATRCDEAGSVNKDGRHWKVVRSDRRSGA